MVTSLVAKLNHAYGKISNNSIKNKASGISFLVFEAKAIECRHKSSQSRVHGTLCFHRHTLLSPHIFFTK